MESGIWEACDKIRYLFQTKSKDPILFVTLTTQQSNSGITDHGTVYALKLWLQHKKCKYLFWCERQRNTGDIHWHGIMNCKLFDFAKETAYWSSLIGAVDHPALIQADFIRDVKGLGKYLQKYLVKSANDKFMQKALETEITKPPYSSYFSLNRCFLASQGLSKKYRSELQLRFPIEYKKYLEVERVKFGDYCDYYTYNDKVLQRAKWLRYALKRAGMDC